MRTRIHAALTCGLAGVLIGALLSAAGPAAAAEHESQGAPGHTGSLMSDTRSEAHASLRVSALQRQLRRAGERPGAIDGRYGPLTETAVQRFQRRQGLPVNGLVGKATAAALSERPASRGRVPSFG